MSEIFNSKILNSTIINGILEINCRDLHQSFDQIKNKVRLIDVRRPDEFNAELGHIETAELFTLGSELTNFLKTADKNQEIIFICRGGVRSITAFHESVNLGFTNVANMTGGMMAWNSFQLPTVK